jgi:hypothetical protein
LNAFRSFVVRFLSPQSNIVHANLETTAQLVIPRFLCLLFNLCLLQLEMLFREHRFPRRVLNRVRVDRVLWAWAGEVPVVLSWTGPGKSVDTGHSDMPGCGCTKCSHSRPKPRPARPKTKPKPKPKAAGKKKRYGR